MPGIGCDRHHRLGRRPKQQTIHDSLVLPGDVGDLGWQGEDDVEIADWQQVGLALGKPGPRGCALALRAMPVAAAVIGDAEMTAVIAAVDMTAEWYGSSGSPT